jgi:hypothetical protein
MAGLMHMVLGSASLISLLVLSPRRTWRHVLCVLREHANTLPDHSQVVCREGTEEIRHCQRFTER